MPQEKPKNPFRTHLEEYLPSHTEILDSTVPSNPMQQSKIHPSRSSKRRFEAGTPAPNKISIKIQQERTISTLS